MDVSFLGVPDVSALLFSGLAFAAFCTAFLGITTGTAGGLLLLALMALYFPPAVLVPVHTVVQLGAGSSRALMMWRYVMRSTLPPFVIGAVIGAATGAQIYVALPTAALQGIIGAFILLLAWLPKIARVGSEGRRFAVLGFAATFLGMFVSATGTLLGPFVLHSSPDRRNYSATFAAMMTAVHLSKLVAFGALGVALAVYVPLMAAMIGGAAMGNWVGGKVLDRIPERRFRIVFQVLLTLLALRLLWVAARAGGLF
jgi:uncharacterized membrane protein YfcA